MWINSTHSRSIFVIYRRLVFGSYGRPHCSIAFVDWRGVNRNSYPSGFLLKNIKLLIRGCLWLFYFGTGKMFSKQKGQLFDASCRVSCLRWSGTRGIWLPGHHGTINLTYELIKTNQKSIGGRLKQQLLICNCARQSVSTVVCLSSAHCHLWQERLCFPPLLCSLALGSILALVYVLKGLGRKFLFQYDFPPEGTCFSAKSFVVGGWPNSSSPLCLSLLGLFWEGWEGGLSA